jgi:hypothetical protein
MSCDVFITRMDFETGDNSNKITLEEWLQFVSNDSELEIIESSFGINPITKEKIYIQNPGLAIWKSDDEEFEIYYKVGSICSQDYDSRLIDKMKYIAKQLNAKLIVEGEEI